MRWGMILIMIVGVIGSFFAFLTQYKMLFMYIIAMLFFVAVTFKVIKNVAAKRKDFYG